MKTNCELEIKVKPVARNYPYLGRRNDMRVMFFAPDTGVEVNDASGRLIPVNVMESEFLVVNKHTVNILVTEPDTSHNGVLFIMPTSGMERNWYMRTGTDKWWVLNPTTPSHYFRVSGTIDNDWFDAKYQPKFGDTYAYPPPGTVLTFKFSLVND